VNDAKILFTGATGQALRPAAEALTADNEVWCLARFTNPEVKAQLEAKGIRTFPWTMGEGSLVGLDDDFTHVVHGAPYRGQPDSNTTAQANAVGAGQLMYHCRRARAFVFVSTFGVYAKPRSVDHPIAEGDLLGGCAPYAPTYPVGKAAAEGAVRAFAAVLDLPTTIARLNVCYGPTGWGGVPVEFFARVLAGEPLWLPPDAPDIWSSPISTEDVARFLPGLFDVASTAPTIVNLAGDDILRLTEYMRDLADEAGLAVSFVPSDESRQSFASDNTRRLELIGPCRVGWKEGMRAAIAAHYPGAFDGPEGRPVVEVKANIWGQR
jgi:nucleoside-diphosphate-sugar epimerase